VQLLVQRPIQSESTITVDAYKPSQQGDSPACSDALISSMAKVVEPDGDNTVQGPARDNDPNTDTQNQTDQDRENVENAQRDAENEAQKRAVDAQKRAVINMLINTTNTGKVLGELIQEGRSRGAV